MIRQVGHFLFAPGVMALTALPYCLFEENNATFTAFAATAAICLTVAALLQLIPARKNQKTYTAMATVALVWLLMGVVCGLPLYLTAQLSPAGSEAARTYGTFINAFFEGMSGVTSCGLTLSARPDLLPSAIQWWRSLCEWVGGVGVVVLMLLLIEPAEHNYTFYRAEARQWRLKQTSLRHTAGRIWTIFAGLTVLSVIALHSTGAPWWEAVNHGMTAIATGGFTIRADSFQQVEAAVRFCAMLFMVLGVVSFRSYSRLLYDRVPPWRHATQIRWLAALLLAGGAAVVAVTRIEPHEVPIERALFQWVSALGTCGFSAVDLSGWGPAALVLLMLGMIVGGASGSTTGGIKIARVVWLCKNSVKHLQNRMRDSDTLESYRFNGQSVSSQEAIKRIRYAALLAGLWVVALTTGWLVMLLALPRATPVHLLFECASALGSVGLSTGITEAQMPAAAKLCLTMLMWLGRLEIISAVMLLTLPITALRRAKRP